MSRKSIAIWIAISAGVIAVLIGLGVRHWRPRWSIIQGAVIRRDTDPRKQSPIAGVSVTASAGSLQLQHRIRCIGVLQDRVSGNSVAWADGDSELSTERFQSP